MIPRTRETIAQRRSNCAGRESGSFPHRGDRHSIGPAAEFTVVPYGQTTLIGDSLIGDMLPTFFCHRFLVAKITYSGDEGGSDPRGYRTGDGAFARWAAFSPIVRSISGPVSRGTYTTHGFPVA